MESAPLVSAHPACGHRWVVPPGYQLPGSDRPAPHTRTFGYISAPVGATFSTVSAEGTAGLLLISPWPVD